MGDAIACDAAEVARDIVPAKTKDWGRHEGVVIIPRRSDGKIILAQRLGKDRPFLGCYAAPGGSVEEGEEARAAAVRELREETGLDITPDRPFFLARTGPHLTPVEEGGSGKKYYVTYFGLELLDARGEGDLRIPAETLKRTEPEKQGPWEANTYGHWILETTLVPGFGELVERMHRTKRSLVR